MNVKAKQIFGIICVLLVVYLIAIIFAMFSPYIFSLNVALPVKMLIELLPFILMVGIVAVVCKIQRKPLSVGLGFKKSSIAKQLLITAIIFVATISLFIIIPLICGADKSDVLSFKARSPLILVYQIVKCMVFVGMGEEIVWRGYLYEEIRGITGSGIWAVVISSVLFGLWHYPIGQNILQVLMTTIIGLIYGFARLKIKDCSTLSVGIAHGLHDTFILVLSYILL